MAEEATPPVEGEEGAAEGEEGAEGDDKKKEKGVPLAFEEEADGGAEEIVATAELEPWARIGTLRIACQVLEKDDDDLSWQFELADLWFR